jgi:hypothetical protein
MSTKISSPGELFAVLALSAAVLTYIVFRVLRIAKGGKHGCGGDRARDHKDY